MNVPNISIIIPIYNVEKFIDKCILSVINQTLQDIEIILVDDESPDNCPQMCDDYAKKDSRIKVVHKKNGGLGFARNSGLEVATGEYVTFLDSDDFVDLCTYEHLYNILKSENLDAVYYKFERFVNEDEVKEADVCNEIIIHENEEVKKIMLDIIASEPSDRVDHKIHCSSCTAIYRLDLIKNNNVQFHSERELISEDLIFNLDFLKNANIIAFNNGRHYHYRLVPTSLTSKIRPDRVEKIKILYDFIKDNIKFWGFDYVKAEERNNKLFIGGCRNAITKYLSNGKDRRQWLEVQLSMPIWNEIYLEYNWKRLPLYPKLFFLFCAKKKTLMLFMISRIKKFLA